MVIRSPYWVETRTPVNPAPGLPAISRLGVALGYGRAARPELIDRRARLEEREQLAASLHDGLAQWLSQMRLEAHALADSLQAQQLEPAAQASQALLHSLDCADHELRCAIATLRAAPRVPVSLHNQLTEVIDGLEQGWRLCVQSHIETSASLRLSAPQAEQVRLIVREALLNIAKHAQTTRATVTLSREGSWLHLVIEDAGCGFDLDQAVNGPTHFGLSIMRARAAQLHGQLSLVSIPGQGTRLCLRWPLEAAQVAGESLRR